MLTGIVPVNAQSYPVQDILIRSMTVSLVLDSNGTTTITIDAMITNTGPNGLSEVGLRIDSMNLIINEVKLDGTHVDARLELMERHSMLMVPLIETLRPNATTYVRVYLTSLDLQSTPEEDLVRNLLYRSLIFYMRPHNPVHNLTVVTTLPVRGVLSTRSVVPLFPEPIRNMTDGQSLTFIWITSYLQPGQEKVFIIKYSVPIETPPVSTTLPLILGFFLVSGVIIGIAFIKLVPLVHVYFSRLGKNQNVGMTKEETAVIELLKQKGGSCRQKELYLELNLLESKTSLLLSSMEQRGMIRRFRKGREKLVYLIEE